MQADNDLTLAQKVEMLQQQLAQAQQLTALGELLSTTTHEFNNVLMTLINYAQMGIRHRDDATRDKAFNKVLAAAQRASKITQGILGVARNRSHGFEPTDLAKLIGDSLVLLELEMRRHRIVVETVFEDVPLVMANGNQIQQVLLNLMINARQAMPQRGRITIRLRYEADDNMVALIVRDTGQGIEPDDLPKIFDPFFSTKSGPDATGKGGTGLGLASCRSIVEAHQGRIRVRSTVGKGTEFTIKLPVAPPDSQPAPDHGAGAYHEEPSRGLVRSAQ